MIKHDFKAFFSRSFVCLFLFILFSAFICLSKADLVSYQVQGSSEYQNIPDFKFNPKKIPPLANVPFANETGVLNRVFGIAIPEVKYPYNPSIIKKDGGYLLAYRYDPKYIGSGIRPVLVGLIHLDENFLPKSESTFLMCKDNSSEDPRFLETSGGTYVVYTHVTSNTPLLCNMAMTKIDENTLQNTSTIEFKNKGTTAEKNWTPFAIPSEKEEDRIFFIYKYCPQIVYQLKSTASNEVSVFYKGKERKALLEWQEKWGQIRGGSNPIRIGNEFITFFHSSFRSGGINYYVMGAITFDATAPFQIRRISKEPIIYKGMYATPITPDMWFYPRNHLRVLFPSGAVAGIEDEREVFYVVCGENDVTIKCVVIDKDNLMKRLKDVQ